MYNSDWKERELKRGTHQKQQTKPAKQKKGGVKKEERKKQTKFLRTGRRERPCNNESTLQWTEKKKKILVAGHREKQIRG